MEAPMTPPPTINTSGCAMLCSLRPPGYRRGPASEAGRGVATSRPASSPGGAAAVVLRPAPGAPLRLFRSPCDHVLSYHGDGRRPEPVALADQEAAQFR